MALETLMDVLIKQAYSNISLNRHLQEADLSVKDRQLATRLVYGTLQNELFLDYQLKLLLTSKLQEKFIRPLLLVSLYQLTLMDKIPARAVLDEANKLAKAFGKKHSGAFRLVNGVLRSFQRRGVVLPDAQDTLKYQSIKYSLPVWLLKLFNEDFGQTQTTQIINSLNQPAKNSIRVSSQANVNAVFQELKVAGFAPEKSAVSAKNLILRRGGVSQSRLFRQGKITLQDESAGLVTDCFDFQGNEQVLDACAAPGGKTVQMAEKLPQGQVTALDIHPNKLKLIEKYARRMQPSGKINCLSLDARQALAKFGPASFEAILVDAPCSGLGLLRRKPEIRLRKSKQDIVNLSRIQLAILNAVAPCLKAGGQLVYSTCSITKKENEEVIQNFLQQNPAFSLRPFKLEKLPAKSGMLKILPNNFMSDGFFMAKLEKSEVNRG